jgi:hypothetical protein
MPTSKRNIDFIATLPINPLFINEGAPQNTPQNEPQNEPKKLIAQLTPRQQQINKNKNLHICDIFCTFAGEFGYNYNFRR